MRRLTVFCFVLLVIIHVEAAGSSSATKPAPTTAPAAKRYTEFAKKLEKEVNAGNANFFQKHLDIKAIADKAMSGLGLLKQLKTGFRKGVEASFNFPYS